MLDFAYMLVVLTGVIQAGALVLVGVTLLKIRKAQQFKTLTELHEELNTDQVQKAFRFIYQNHNRPGGLVPFHSEDEMRSVERVLNAYDLIALRTQQGVVQLDDVLATDWRLVLPLWRCTLPFIEKQRELRGSMPDSKSKSAKYKGVYKGPLQWLVEQAEIYRTKHNLEMPKSFNASVLIKTPPAAQSEVTG